MKIKQNLEINIIPNYDSIYYEKGSEYGRITIDDYYEHFYMSPQVWTMKQYQQQWKLALERIHTHDTSYFMQNIQLSNRIAFMWTMQKLHDRKQIKIKNILIIEDDFEKFVAPIKDLTPENSFLCLPDLKKEDEEFYKYLNSLSPESDEYKEMIDLRENSDQWYVDYED